MNLIRAITDGILMAICFNASVLALCLMGPRYFLDAYPKSIQKLAEPMTNKEKRVNKVFTVLVVGFLLVYGAFSQTYAGTKDFWSFFITGYINWLFVNFGDFFFLDLWFFQKYKDRITIPGTENHQDYKLKNWMKSLGYKEHLFVFPFLLSPVFALIQGALGLLMNSLF